MKSVSYLKEELNQINSQQSQSIAQPGLHRKHKAATVEIHLL